MNIDGKDEQPVTIIEKPWSIRSDMASFLGIVVIGPISIAIVTYIIIYLASQSLTSSISVVIGVLWALPFSYLIVNAIGFSIPEWRPQQVHLENDSIIRYYGKKEKTRIPFARTTSITVALYKSLVDPPRKDIDYHKIIEEIHGKRIPSIIMGIFIENNEHKIIIGPNVGWSKEDMETIWGPLLRIINTHETSIGSNLKRVLNRYSIERT